MALPTGQFSSTYAGVLTVTLSCVFSASRFRDAGFPSSGGATGGTNVALRGYAGPAGSPSYTAIVDKYNLISQIDLAYPGGNVAWPIGVTLIANQTDMTGIYGYGMGSVRLSCRLRKK